MKKFFSAILLMTMMVFSVGTFVSCNDLVDEMQGIQGQVDGQQAAIKALNDEIAVLESALATAQSTADAAKKAADDAAAAAAQAKADAIADAKAQVEALKSAYEGKIAEIEATLAGKVSKEELDAAVKAASDGVNAALEVINTKLATIEATIKDLQDKKADKAELDAEVAKLLEADTKINTQLAALENYIKNLEVGGSANASQIDSIRTELANAAAEIEDLWAFLQDENTGLYALVAGNSSAITAMQEDFQAALDELYADIYGEGPNSLFTMVGQHAGLIQDLDERMTAAEEAILANNQALSIAVKIANQIQSVVYVPTADYIPSMSYYLGDNTLTTKRDESPLMIMATYEVSPKALVETLEDVNVGFATVATKVAGAEYFAARIVERDATTGRMVVVGYIDEDTDAYKALTTGTAGDVANVAFNLNVSVSAPFNVEDEDGLQASIDAGTFVVSTYTKATVAGAAKNLADKDANGDYYVRIGWNDGGKLGYVNNFLQPNPVPYNPTGEPSARSIFSNYRGLYVYFEGTFLPLDRASEVLGFELVPTYGEFKATYNNAWNKKSPIAVSGEGFETVATLVGSDDYKDADAIGQSVTVAVNGVKLNDAALGNKISAEYSVTYKTADITLSSTAFTWSYKYGDTLESTDDDFPWFESVTELDVVGFDDITVLYDGDPADPTSEQFSPTEPLKFTGKAKDSKGKEYTATVGIKSLSKKAVRITATDTSIPFAKGEDLTYKFNAILYDKDRVQYTLAFEFTTSAMPTDKEIVLNPVKADAKFTYAMTADVDPILSVLAVDGAYYPEATINTEVLPLINAFAADANNAASTLKVYKGNSEVTNAAANGYDFDISWLYVAYGDYVAYNEESSEITIPSANIGDKFTYVYEYNVFGVKYTFKVAAEVVKATGYSLSLNSAYVNSDNTVLLNRGTVVYPEVPTKPGTSPIPAGTPYQLQEIDLREYVHVNGETDDDNTATTNELALVYTVLNNHKATKSGVSYYYQGDNFSTIEDGDLYTHANNAVYYQSSSVTPLSTVNEGIMPLTWNLTAVDVNNDYIGRYNSTITVRIDLVANTDNDDMYDFTKQINYGSVTVNLVVPELLEASAIKPVVDKKGNQTGAVSVLKTKDATTGTLEWETVNVVEGLKVTAKNSTKSILYNQEATQLNEFWHNYTSTNPAITTGTDANVFGKILNQTEVKIPTDQYGQFVGVSARYQTSGATVHPDNYVVDPDGTVKLTANSGEITDNIIVTVPVIFYHDYCSNNHYTEVEVLFVK